jgi:predicted glycoside hydrolase/deacetylase ChbG (UPF0249 family)
VNISPIAHLDSHHHGENNEPQARFVSSFAEKYNLTAPNPRVLPYDRDLRPGDQNNEREHISAASISPLVVAVANAHRTFTGPAYA